MRSIYLAFLLVPMSVALAAREEMTFERYQIIIDRAPFGSLPPSRPEGPAANPNQPPPPSFADSLRVSSIIDDPDTGLKRVGFFDEQKKESFHIILGDTNNAPPEGYELLSVDYDKEEVLLQKGEERALVKLSSGKAERVPATRLPPGMPATTQRGPPVPVNQDSYAQRREAMRGRMRSLPQQPVQPEAPAEPKYTGQELQKHLSDYKMDVIRQGLPALPIPLTKEEDDQLVKEGVLPPQ